MRVSILGAGAIAYGAAAYLGRAGHDPMLWSPSGTRTAGLAAGKQLIATNAIEGTFTPRIATSCADAVDSADVVMIAVPGYGQKAVLKAASAHLRDGQPVIISSHTSFGALYLSKELVARGIRAPIIAWGTTLTTGRQESLTQVNVSTVRQKIDLATVPDNVTDEGYELCTVLFGDRFVRRDGLLAIALSNLNPQNHLGIALLNLTRMERGEVWSQSKNVTPTVGRVIEALDDERLAIAKAFGVLSPHSERAFLIVVSRSRGKRFGNESRDGSTGPRRSWTGDSQQPVRSRGCSFWPDTDDPLGASRRHIGYPA